MTRLYNPLLSAIQTPLMGVANGPTLLAHYINGVDSLPTTSRTATIYARDHEGVYRDYQAGEVVIEGGRQVRNLLSDSDDFSQSSWVKTGATVTGTNTVNFFSTNDFIRQSPNAPIVGETYVTRVKLSGSGSIRFRITGSGGTYEEAGADITLTSTPTVYSLILTIANSGHTALYPTLIKTASSTATEVTVTEWQLENVTGQSNQNPGEYVSSTVGMQTFATENGNTVASNVVTEGTGSALSPAPAVVTQPAFTNSCAYSQDLTGTGWSGSATTAQDQTDIFGNANTAWTVTDNSAVAYDSYNYGVSIPNDTNTNAIRLWVKKTTSATSFPSFIMQMSGGTTARGAIVVNTDTGVATDWPDAPDQKSVDSDGDWWRVTISKANNGTGNTFLSLQMMPASSATGGLPTSSAVTGSCIVDQMEIHLNPTNGHESVRYAGPIPTSGAAATTNPTEPVVSWPSGLGNDFVVKCRFTPASATQLSFARMLDWSGGNQDGYSIQISAGVFYFYKRISGTGYRTDRAQSLVAGTEYPIIFRASSLNGIAAWVSGTKSSGGSNPGNTDTPVTPSTVKVGGSDIATNLNALGKFTDIKIYSVPPDISDAEVLAL